MNIYEKLLVIQTKLNAPKNQHNKFGNYYYRSCEDILEGLKSHLEETKTTVTVSDEVVLIGERYYIKATATLHDCEEAGCVTNTAYAREELSKKGMDASQITGATSSYARKYALNGLFCIDDVKDNDTNERKKETDAKKKEAEEQAKTEAENKKIENSVINKVKVNALLKRCSDEEVAVEKILKLYNVTKLEELTELKYANINLHWNKIKEA